MKTAAYIIMLVLCAGIVVMNYKLNGQPRKEQVYNYKKGLYSAIILAVLASLFEIGKSRFEIGKSRWFFIN